MTDNVYRIVCTNNNLRNSLLWGLTFISDKLNFRWRQIAILLRTLSLKKKRQIKSKKLNVEITPRTSLKHIVKLVCLLAKRFAFDALLVFLRCVFFTKVSPYFGLTNRFRLLRRLEAIVDSSKHLLHKNAKFSCEHLSFRYSSPDIPEEKRQCMIYTYIIHSMSEKENFSNLNRIFYVANTNIDHIAPRIDEV